MSSSVCSPGQGLHSIPSPAQKKVDCHLSWMWAGLAGLSQAFWRGRQDEAESPEATPGRREPHYSSVFNAPRAAG